MRLKDKLAQAHVQNSNCESSSDRFDAQSNPDIVSMTEHHKQNMEQSISITSNYSGEHADSLSVTEIGDQDLELLEMTVYDTYHQDDGAPYSYNYLIDCRRKLMGKLDSCRKEVEELKKLKLKTEAWHKVEIKRIR